MRGAEAAVTPTKRTPERVRAALAAYRKYGTVRQAARKIGIGRSTWYDWLEADPELFREFVAASEDVVDELEEEAIKRAKHGSDALLTFLLRAKRPQVYRERVQVESGLSREELMQFMAAMGSVVQRYVTDPAALQLIAKGWEDLLTQAADGPAEDTRDAPALPAAAGR